MNVDVVLQHGRDLLRGHVEGLRERIALIPFPVLGPIIILCSVIGAYCIRFMLFDVRVALLSGEGYLMRKLHFPIAPLVLATVFRQMLVNCWIAWSISP